jgi:hypothetical protein
MYFMSENFLLKKLIVVIFVQSIISIIITIFIWIPLFFFALWPVSVSYFGANSNDTFLSIIIFSLIFFGILLMRVYDRRQNYMRTN